MANELQNILENIRADKNKNLLPKNIKKGVKVLGVVGTADYGIDTEDATATADAILEGQTAYAKEKKLTGTIPSNGTINITPSTEDKDIPFGFTTGGTVVGDENLTPNNIRAGVTIFGVEGNVEPDKPDQEKTVIPTTEDQEVFGDTGYELGKVTVKGVNANIDENIIPENIKEGTTILGIEGTLGFSDYDNYNNCEDIVTLINTKTDKTNEIVIPKTFFEATDKNGKSLQAYLDEWGYTSFALECRKDSNGLLPTDVGYNFFNVTYNKVIPNPLTDIYTNPTYNSPSWSGARITYYVIYNKLPEQKYDAWISAMKNSLDVLNICTKDIYWTPNGGTRTLLSPMFIVDEESGTPTELEISLQHILDNKLEVLRPEVLKQGTTFLGVQGTLEEGIDTSDADAISADILSNKTAYVNNTKLTGTMVNNGELHYTPTTEEQTIPAGYTSGGIINAAVMSESDYNTCLDLCDIILASDIPYITYNYLKSTKSSDNTGSFINTNLKADQNTEAIITFKVQHTNKPVALFGNRDVAGKTFMLGVFEKGYAVIGDKGGTFGTTFPIETNIKYTLKLNKTGVYRLVGTNWVNIVEYENVNDFETNGNIYLFSEYISSIAPDSILAEIYEFKVYNNDELIQHLVPIKYSDGTGAMYDKVTKQVFTNQRPNYPFTLGND